MGTNLDPNSASNMRIRDYAYLALCSADAQWITTRDLLGEMTQIKVGVRKRLLTNRYLPSVHKLALVLKNDNRFIKKKCTILQKAIWSVNNDED